MTDPTDPNLVSCAGLQNALGISWTTPERWIRIYRCPVETRGGQGEAWQFYLPKVVTFAALRRLMPLNHKISLPCRECEDWVHGLRVGAHLTGNATCPAARKSKTVAANSLNFKGEAVLSEEEKRQRKREGDRRRYHAGGKLRQRKYQRKTGIYEAMASKEPRSVECLCREYRKRPNALATAKKHFDRNRTRINSQRRSFRQTKQEASEATERSVALYARSPRWNRDTHQSIYFD